jgi:ethanolaminephosphotransferase
MFSPPPTSKASKWIAFAVCLALVLTCTSVFYAGFFPSKVVVPGEASHSANAPPVGGDPLKTPHSVPAPKFKKMVFMLVDSLRSDFISKSSSGFTFVRSLLSQGKAYAYRAHAHPPTVTLPRIKAIVTGGIPSFSDYLNNFQSSAIDQDNIIWQMQRHSKCIAFYGDDTWIKLFPNSFSRYEGTTSFFVADTIIVDHNVTRNLEPELERYRQYRRNVASEANTKSNLNGAGDETKAQSPSLAPTVAVAPELSSRGVCEHNSDWDVLILHYLGLDHIGHLQGPRSALMFPKQVEMNDIFERIYKELGDDTLLVMSGDHGMNEEGAHGGPSEGETSPALILASPRFNRFGEGKIDEEAATSPFPKIDQIDLVPTLATLLGIPTPLNSVGKLIPDVMQALFGDSKADLLRAYQLNSLQIHRLLKTSPSICANGNIQQYYDASPCVGVTDSVRATIEQFGMAKSSHERFASSSDQRDFESALASYQSFLHASSSLFAHALSEYDDYLLFSAIAGFAIASLFAVLVFKSSIKHHPPLLMIVISTIIHFVIDTVLLTIYGSALASFWLRFFASLTAGYCLAHIILVAKQTLGSIPIVSSSEMIRKKWLPSAINAIEKFFPPSEIVGGFLSFVLLLGVFIRPIVYSSSSFIEEEHLTFFYMCCTSMFALLHHIIASAPTSNTPNGPFMDASSWLNVMTLLLALVAMRTGRLWNQSGFQGIGQPDVSQLLNVTYPGLRNLLVVATFLGLLAYVLYHVFTFLERSKSSFGSTTGSSWFSKLGSSKVARMILRVWVLGWLVGWFGTFLFQLSGSHSWAMLAHYGYFVSISSAMVWFLSSAMRDAASIGECLQLFFWSVFGILVLLARYHNVPLLGLWFIQAHCMLKLSQGYSPSSTPAQRFKDWIFAGACFQRTGGVVLPFWKWSLLMFNLGQYAYFSQGNSNSLASIDIAGAYAGLSGYQDSLVGLFVAMLLYAGPLTFQFSLLLIFVFQEVDSKQESASTALTPTALSCHPGSLINEQPLHLAMLECLRVRLLARSWSLIIYSIFITLHRGHLFIWSVFAPKLLYEMFHSIAFFLQTIAYFTFGLACMWFIRRNHKATNDFNDFSRGQRQNHQFHPHPHQTHPENPSSLQPTYQQFSSHMEYEYQYPNTDGKAKNLAISSSETRVFSV